MNVDYKTLPKIELHVHLDCSLSFDVVKKLNPNITESEYKASFVLPPKCHDLLEYIEIASKGPALMQTKEALVLVTQDIFDQFRQDHVIYAELRFAPLLHLEEGLTSVEVVETVNETVAQCVRETGIEASIILCTLRHFSEEQSMETVNLVDQFKDTYVAGFDIAADEAGYPLTEHLKAFEYARNHEISITAHAGEAKGPESVWETLEKLKVSRIGHGVRSAEDEALVAHLADKHIHLEVCPTSNVTTDTVRTLNHHPIDHLYKKGVSLSVSTDARGFLDLSLADEYEKLTEQFQWEKEHFLKCNLEAINYAFTSEEKKAILRRKILEAYK